MVIVQNPYSLSADSDDHDVLIPAHFLIERPITAIPDHNLLTVSDNRLKFCQTVTKVILNIWNYF